MYYQPPNYSKEQVYIFVQGLIEGYRQIKYVVRKYEINFLYIKNADNCLELPDDYKDFLSCAKRKYAKNIGSIESYIDYVKDAAIIYGCSII